MIIIDHSTPENAKGRIAQVYTQMSATGVPEPLLVMSASPMLFNKQAGLMSYFLQHNMINPEIFAAIRYLVSVKKDYDACVDFNGRLLDAMGVSDDELKAMVANPLDGPFGQKENMLIDFAIRSVLSPEKITRSDLDELIKAGWMESDAVDAVHHAASMTIPGILSKAFTE